MWARSYYLWLVLAGGIIRRSAQKPMFLSAYKAAWGSPGFVHFPGADASLDESHLLKFTNLASPEDSTASTSTHVHPTSNKEGKGSLCGVLGCFGQPGVEVERSPPQTHAILEHAPDQQRSHLAQLTSHALDSRPKAQNLLDEFRTSTSNSRSKLIQDAFQYLTNAKGLSQTEVGTWVELFTLMAKTGKTNLNEGSKILWGFHTVYPQHARDEKISQYLDLAIAVIKKHFNKKMQLELVATDPWIREMFYPQKGPSQDLLDFNKFQEMLSWDEKLAKFFAHNEDPRAKVSALISSAKRATPGVLAQSKTAAIIFIYHLSQSSDQELSTLGRNSILELKAQKDQLSEHDATLVDFLTKDMAAASTSTSP